MPYYAWTYNFVSIKVAEFLYQNVTNVILTIILSFKFTFKSKNFYEKLQLSESNKKLKSLQDNNNNFLSFYHKYLHCTQNQEITKVLFKIDII